MSEAYSPDAPGTAPIRQRDDLRRDQELKAIPLALAPPGQSAPGWPAIALLCGLTSVALVLYSISLGFVWDEGFHLLAAQLINKGRTPYLDFCFPQTPLNAYWNAAWMRWTHHAWRVTHVLASLEVAGAIALSTQFVYSRMAGLRWQTAATIIALLGTGLNSTLWKFGTCAQAYGLGTFLAVASFRTAVYAAGTPSAWPVFAAGLLVGLASASTLLTAPLGVALLIWQFMYHRSGSLRLKLPAFCCGALLPFLPVFYLFFKDPQATFFNVVQYQAIFRRINWSGATAHDFDVLTAWLNDAPSLLLGAFALVGIASLRRFSSLTPERRAEYVLSAWIAAGFLLYIATAHPTFQRYFVFAVPFISICAAPGIVALFSRLGYSARPFSPALVLSLLLTLAFAKSLFDDRDAATWANYRQITAKIRQVTPPGGLIYADEHVYFLMNLTPPPAMEFSYSHKLELPPDLERRYHIVSEKELNEQVRRGRFATVETCKDERIEAMQLDRLFPKVDEIGDCSIYSGKMKAPPPPPVNQSSKQDIATKP